MAPLKPLNTSDWGRDDLLREARLQTDAIQRLNAWLRLGYSLLAAGFIVGYWGFYGGGGTGFGWLGVALIAVGAGLALVLKIGTTNAKRNVRAIMTAAGVDISQKRGGKHGERGVKAQGSASTGHADSTQKGVSRR